MNNKTKIISLALAGAVLLAVPAMANEAAKMHKDGNQDHMKYMMMYHGKHAKGAMHQHGVLGEIMHSKEYAQMSDEDRAAMETVIAGVVKKWLPELTPIDKGDCPAMNKKPSSN